MGNLTNKNIRALVNAAKDNLADVIEEHANNNIGNSEPIEFDVNIKIGIDDTRCDNYAAVQTCMYICYSIGGSIYCFRYCFN